MTGHSLNDPEDVARRQAIARQLLQDSEFVERYRSIMQALPPDHDTWDSDLDNPNVRKSIEMLRELDARILALAPEISNFDKLEAGGLFALAALGIRPIE